MYIRRRNRYKCFQAQSDIIFQIVQVRNDTQFFAFLLRVVNPGNIGQKLKPELLKQEGHDSQILIGRNGAFKHTPGFCPL
ncbi:hypothetical protein D3C80_1501920 [compost metagenome]